MIEKKIYIALLSFCIYVMKFLFRACTMLVSPKISKILSNVLRLEIACSIVNSYVANVYKCWIEHIHVLDDNAPHLLFLSPKDKLDTQKHKVMAP